MAAAYHVFALQMLIFSPPELQIRENGVFDAAHLEGWEEGLAKGMAEGKTEGIIEGKAVGKAEGIIEGKAKGKAEANLETARKLKDLGLDFEVIAKGTGLTVEEISKL